MRHLILSSLCAITELSLELAARSVDVLGEMFGDGPTRATLERRIRELEQRNAELSADMAAGRRVDRARMNEIERLRAGRYWKDGAN